MLLYLIELIITAVVIAYSADQFIHAAVALSQRLKLPSLVVGIVIVGFGTSFPEMVVSALAAVQNKTIIAVANVVGSNSANIGLVLGVAALVRAIRVHPRILSREFLLFFGLSIIVYLLLANYFLSRLDGVILLLLLIGYLSVTCWQSIDQQEKLPPIAVHRYFVNSGLAKIISWLLVSLAVLLASSHYFIQAAVELAKLLGLSDLVIGLTIVTIGTSLPELAATVVSVLRNQHDIAIGHIMGSNVFNLLSVLAMPALIHPTKLPNHLLWRDYSVMVGFSLLLWVALRFFSPKKQVGRLLGAALLLLYSIYIYWVV